MQGKDVVGQSQTGSGKTVAFAAPAIEKVVVEERTTQVLILCPTRELAVQVAEEVHKLALFKRGLHALPIYGGQSYDRQLFGLRQGAHIVIGTPGRIMDHMRRGTLRLNTVKMVVLDEVDVMLNMGFRDDIELILQGTPKERQTVFFSATIPRPIQQLIEKYSRDPQIMRIEQKAMTVPTVEQFFYEVDRRYKVDLLTRLIDIHDFKLGLIFCNTRRMVDDLVEHLNAQGYSADRLHGEMTQMMRDRVMNKFRKSGLEFLVATDVAARGIDVENIEVVFNYDLPYDGEDYVHRIGRTGRQGRSGRAISFASGREVFQIRAIERYVNTRIHRARRPPWMRWRRRAPMWCSTRFARTLKSGEYQDGRTRSIERLLEEGFSSTELLPRCCIICRAEKARPRPRPRARMRGASASRWERRVPPAGQTERGPEQAGRGAPQTRRRDAGATKDPCMQRGKEVSAPTSSGRHAAARSPPADGSVFLSRSGSSGRARAGEGQPQPSQATASGSNAANAGSPPARRTGPGLSAESQPPDAGGPDAPLCQCRRGDGRLGRRYRWHGPWRDGAATEGRRRGGHPGAASVCGCGVARRN